MTKNNKVAFVTDSTVFLSERLKNHPDVYVVPIIVISEGKEYEDGVDLTSDTLYDIIRNDKNVPKTSQPSVGKFAELYQQLKEKYDHAIAIHVSNKLSGTFASSKAGSVEANFPVEMVDSCSLSHTITTLIYKGMDLIDKGFNVQEIAKRLRMETKRSRNLILLGSLEQLYKGGRMSGVQFLLGNVLNIKPILTINNEGELGLFERVRSEKKAVNRIVQLLKESCEKNKVTDVQIMHGNVINKAHELKEKIKSTIPNLRIAIGEISSSLAVHAGEGTLAIIWHLE